MFKPSKGVSLKFATLITRFEQIFPIEKKSNFHRFVSCKAQANLTTGFIKISPQKNYLKHVCEMSEINCCCNILLPTINSAPNHSMTSLSLNNIFLMYFYIVFSLFLMKLCTKNLCMRTKQIYNSPWHSFFGCFL